MIQFEKDCYILALRLNHSQFSKILSKALSLGKCSDELIEKDQKIMFMTKVLNRYQPFVSKVTNTYKVQFDRLKIGNITLQLQFSTYNYSYTGTEDGNQIALYFKDLINADGQYYSVTNGNILYLYTYDLNESFSDIPRITNSDITTMTTIITSLQNNEDEILDIINCITTEEFCEIKAEAFRLMS